MFLKIHKKQNWDAKYMPNCHICKVLYDRKYDLQYPNGQVRCAAVADSQLAMPAEYIVSMLTNIKAFG